MSNVIKLGYKMVKWLRQIIDRDFGDVSFAKGLYNILTLYNKHVTDSAKAKLQSKKKRLRWI